MKKTTVVLLVLLLCMPVFTTAFGENTTPYTIVSYQASSQGRQPDEKDDILKVLEEKFNADLQLNVITSEYESKLNLEVASGNTPDIMKIGSAQFNAFVEQELLLPLEDYIALMPNLLAKYPDILTDPTLRINGHLYFLKGNLPEKEIVKSFDSLWVRQDWLDNLDLQAPTNLEEFTQVAQAFATKDPDGNGVNDTFGFTGLGGVENTSDHYALNPFFGAFGVGTSHYLLQKDELYFAAAADEYKEALTWIKSLIDTGAVDPDMMLMTSFDAVREKVYRNQVGMIYFSWAEFVKPPYDQTLQEMTPDAKWVQIDDIQGPGGAYDSCYNIPGYASSGWVISADLAQEPEKLERILAYLDYIVAGEGLDLVCYGIEDVHYTRGDGGKIVPTDKVSEVSYAWQHQLMGRDEITYLATKFPTCQDAIEFAKNLNRIDAYNNYVQIPKGLNKSDLDRYVNEETTRFIYGTRDLSTWEDYVNTLYNTYSLKQYIDLGTQTLKEAEIIN